ncbi:MAG TPA: hypothetical protein PL044_11990, partial [Clostridiales bacterium]|nr:hypothetical protein [Clostridiales bacterium]
MNKKISVGLALFFAIVTAAATFALTMSFAKNMFNDMIAGLSERKVINETVDEIGQLIREHYYGKIDETTLNEHIASGYVEGLDDNGSVYMTAGRERRTTGTHYTPHSMTEPIVQHTLEPLVYIGPAEGRPRD